MKKIGRVFALDAAERLPLLRERAARLKRMDLHPDSGDYDVNVRMREAEETAEPEPDGESLLRRLGIEPY